MAKRAKREIGILKRRLIFLMKGHLRVLALLAAITILAAVPAAWAQTQTLRIGQGTEAQGLDPQDISDNPSEEICHHLYEGLVGFDHGSLKIVPKLAEKWEISEDGLIWTFHLRKNVKFHSGSDLNAAAVKKNFDRILYGSYKRTSLYRPVIEEVSVIDDYTVQFKLKMAFGAFLHTLCHTAGLIIDPTSIDGDKDVRRFPSGTGPFMFVNWTQGDRITLKAFDGYRSGRPHLDELVFVNIPEDTSRAMMLETGELDVAERISAFEVEKMRGRKGIAFDIKPTLRVMYIGINNSDPILGDVRVRQALNYAVDRDAICTNIMKGFAKAIDSPVAFDTNGYTPVKGYEYNPDKARSLLAEAGWKLKNGVLEKDGKPLTLKLWTPNGRYPMDYQISQAIQAYISAIGINAKLITMEWGSYLAMTRKPREESTTQLFLLGWSPSTGDADWVLRPLFHSGEWVPKGSNRAFYDNKKVDGYIERGMTEVDTEKRIEYYRKAQELISSDAPWITLFVMDNVVGYRDNIKDLHTSPLEMVDARLASKQ